MSAVHMPRASIASESALAQKPTSTISGRRAEALAGSRIQSKFFLTASATPSAGAASALQSAAGIDWLEIKSVTDAFGGDAFGPSGPYVYIAAVAHGKLDPRDPANSRIVDLDKAPRTNGLVDYQVDVGILRPKDAAVAGNLGQTRFNMPARC